MKGRWRWWRRQGRIGVLARSEYVPPPRTFAACHYAQSNFKYWPSAIIEEILLNSAWKCCGIFPFVANRIRWQYIRGVVLDYMIKSGVQVSLEPLWLPGETIPVPAGVRRGAHLLSTIKPKYLPGSWSASIRFLNGRTRCPSTRYSAMGRSPGRCVIQWARSWMLKQSVLWSLFLDSEYYNRV